MTTTTSRLRALSPGDKVTLNLGGNTVEAAYKREAHGYRFGPSFVFHLGGNDHVRVYVSASEAERVVTVPTKAAEAPEGVTLVEDCDGDKWYRNANDLWSMTRDVSTGHTFATLLNAYGPLVPITTAETETTADVFAPPYVVAIIDSEGDRWNRDGDKFRIRPGGLYYTAASIAEDYGIRSYVTKTTETVKGDPITA